ncbi:MAG: hypothetical protein VW518_06570 [Burkholderiaceae bacterium]
MRALALAVGFLFAATSVSAHELTPTYPKLLPSIVDGLLSAKLNMFNARKDVDYFEIGVFTEDMVPIPFATVNQIIKVPMGTSYTFEIFIRNRDKDAAVYVCTISKLRSDKAQNAIISSKVCSKFDGK